MKETTNEVVTAEKKEDVIYWDNPWLVCTCGWKYKHPRLKVLNRAITKHTTKYGHEYKEKK
jgi:hypothetical protein